MPYTANPVWMFPPNWDNGVLERLEWKTDVLASETGEEQRISRRLTPRRSFEASFLIQRRERQYLDVLLGTSGALPFLIPLWHSVSFTTASSASGTDTLHVDTRWREYEVGGLVILRGPGFNNYEVGEILAVTDSSLQLISDLENTWQSGTYVYPAKTATLADRQQTEKKTDTFVTLTALFLLNQKNASPSGVSSLPAYRGSFVLEARPDESEELTQSYERSLVVLDNDFGVPHRYDSTGGASVNTAYRWAFAGRENNAKLRESLYFLRGRAASLWVPTFMDDFTPAADIVAADGYIDVVNVGYTRLGAMLPGREDIKIETIDGTSAYRRITGSTELGVDLERLVLDSPLLADIPVAQVKTISYIVESRLEQDSIEINHVTDTDGLTVCAVSWRGPVRYNTNDVVWP